ncbi:hypothetical protein [Micromonospora sp. WMMD980]|uniref:hypothetical protein n=1 Tax=Micromonospora sp. WMMD980 TaxID=3016088 RepID=UPI002415AF02|nr:hypothetical protein [Micromonospora sp. WMMD980]MDG4803793.1 hypothetical protein [Micromonospora sp. WMMD980]
MHARFAPVRDAFHDLFAAGRETGAALSVRLDGVPVVELVGGTTAAVPPGAVVPAVGADRPWLAEHDRVNELAEVLHSCL